MARWRRRLDEEVVARGVPAAADLPSGPVRDWVPAHVAGALCPARAHLPDPDFVETAGTASRAVALTALRSITSASSARPAEMVRAVVADPSALRPGLADFIRGLDRAGRAAVVGASTRWLVDAVALAHRRGTPSWQEPFNLRYSPDGCGVTLSAGVDAIRRRGAEVHLLVIRLRPYPPDARLARRTALLWALVRGEEPASVVLGHRESMDLVRHDIDPDVLEWAVSDAADDIRWAQRPSEAPPVPGGECRYCPMLDVCPEGGGHVDEQRYAPFPRPTGTG